MLRWLLGFGMAIKVLTYLFTVGQAGLGAVPAFRVPEYELQSVFELPLVLLLGALCGLAAAAFKASSQVRTDLRSLWEFAKWCGPCWCILMQQ